MMLKITIRMVVVAMLGVLAANHAFASTPEYRLGLGDVISVEIYFLENRDFDNGPAVNTGDKMDSGNGWVI
jgi:protein involved in polysaccharide export with SLBB domain